VGVRDSVTTRAGQSHEGGAGIVFGRAGRGPSSAWRFRPVSRARTRWLRSLSPGDHVILGDDAYGGTYRLLTRIFGNWGLTISTVDLEDLDAVRSAIRESSKMIWLETPSNPLLKVVSISALSEVAHEHGAMLVVDNTFATPYLQRPLTLGADVVVHSTTKYVGGHSDVLGGFVATNNDVFGRDVAISPVRDRRGTGSLDCYLLLRGLKTLGVRMDRHCSNASAIATFLSSHAR